MRIYILLILLVLTLGCREPEASSPPSVEFDGITSLGQKVQSNGYEYDPDRLDIDFVKVMGCLRYLGHLEYLNQSPNKQIYIILKEPYSAFQCDPLPNGCGGLFEVESNGKFIITVTADLNSLKHEYTHYLLYYLTGDADSDHETDNFRICENY